MSIATQQILDETAHMLRRTARNTDEARSRMLAFLRMAASWKSTRLKMRTGITSERRAGRSIDPILTSILVVITFFTFIHSFTHTHEAVEALLSSM